MLKEQVYTMKSPYNQRGDFIKTKVNKHIRHLRIGKNMKIRGNEHEKGNTFLNKKIE